VEGGKDQSGVHEIGEGAGKSGALLCILQGPEVKRLRFKPSALTSQRCEGVGAPVGRMMLNSLVMALAIAFGKIAISIAASFAIVYFRFPLRNFFFWMIFVTLMLPVEVRIIPTFKVAADLHLLDNYPGRDTLITWIREHCSDMWAEYLDKIAADPASGIAADPASGEDEEQDPA